MHGVAAAGLAPSGSSWMPPPVRWGWVRGAEGMGGSKGRSARQPLRPSVSLQRLEGDLELLAVFTHVVMAVSVAALLLTAAVLLSLRSLKSNMRGIHANVAAALGVAELLFLLGIHRTQNQVQGDPRPADLMGPRKAEGARVQGQRSGVLSHFGAGCWGRVRWLGGQRWGEAGEVLMPPQPPPAAVHRGRHPLALLLPGHLRVAPRAGAAPLPHAGGAPQRGPRRHALLSRPGLGCACRAAG